MGWTTRSALHRQRSVAHRRSLWRTVRVLVRLVTVTSATTLTRQPRGRRHHRLPQRHCSTQQVTTESSLPRPLPRPMDLNRPLAPRHRCRQHRWLRPQVDAPLPLSLTVSLPHCLLSLSRWLTVSTDADSSIYGGSFVTAADRSASFYGSAAGEASIKTSLSM